MFDKLKKLLEGGIAQINPFDGGKTFSTVVNQAPRPQAQPVQRAAAPQAAPRPISVQAQRPKMPGILDHLASFSKNVAEPFNQSFIGGLGRQSINIGTKLASATNPMVRMGLNAANRGQSGDPTQNAANTLNKMFFPEAGTKNSLSPTRVQDYNTTQQASRLAGSAAKTATEMIGLSKIGKGVQTVMEGAPIIARAAASAPRLTTLGINATKAAAEAGGGRFLGGLGGNSMFTQNGPESIETAGREGLKWAAAGAVTSPALSVVPNVGKIPIIQSIPRAGVGAGLGAATAPIYGMSPQEGAMFGLLGGSARPINDEAATTLARLNATLSGKAQTGVKLPAMPQRKTVTPTIIDKNTSGAMGRLNALDASTPAPQGTVRVYSGGPADMPLDWSFNNPDALATFHNGRINKGDQFRFSDVLPEDLMEVPGKPGQLRIRPGAKPVNSQSVAIGMADAPYAYEGARGKVRPVSETNRLIEEGKIKAKTPNGAPIAAETAPKGKLYRDPNVNIDPERAAFLKSRGYTEISDGQVTRTMDDIINGKTEAKSYGMSHRPTRMGATADDITTIKKNLSDDPAIGTIPKDFYDNPQNYTNMADNADQESFAALKKIRNNPEAEVTIYRAGPKKQINEGDWVTLSKEYAKREAQAEGVPVHEFKVKAKDVQFAGDSINEFGYFPESKPKAKSRVIANDIPKSWLEPQPKESPFSAKKYVKEQVKMQGEASKGRSPGVFNRFREEFATKGIDALSPIEKPVTDIKGRRGALELRDQLDRSLRSDTIAGQFLRDNGLEDVIKKAPKVDELNQYLIARHAKTLEANGIKTGRDAIKDAQLLEALGPKYEAAGKAVTQYNQKLLDKTVEYGMISKETADFLKKKYPDYVPFDRIFKPEELDMMKGNGAGPASLSKQTVIQRIKGSERQIQPPLESILSKTNDVIAQGERNLAAKEIAKNIDLPGNPLGLKELKPGETIGARPTISFLDNGVKRVFETTPEVAAAAKSLTRQQLGLIGKIMSYPTRALRLGATALNVGFAGANVVKDLGGAFIKSEHPLRASIGNPEVFLKALSAASRHKGKAYGELVRSGAAGTSFDIGRNAAKETVGKIRAQRNVATKALYTVRHPGELIRAMEDTIGRSEEFGRALQYYGNKQAALKSGDSIEAAVKYAADAARNNTTNFARAGEWTRVLNSVLPYFNPGIQGSRAFARSMKLRPAQTATKVAIGAFFPVAATTAWNVGDDTRREAYNDISDYEKQTNMIIVPPNPIKDPETGRWNVIKIPIPQEVAQLSNTVRNGVETMAGDSTFDFAGMMGDLIGTATSLNVDNPRQLVGQITPQAIKPAIETLTNQNLFTGNTIVPDKMKNLDPADQYGKYTSGTARVVGKTVGVSPFQIDNAIRTSFGGLGQNIVNLSDKALAATGAIKPEDVKGRGFADSVSGRFFGAQAKSPSNLANDASKKVMDELKKTPGYQALSPEERAKALNRLENDIKTATYDMQDAKNSTGQYAPDYDGKKDKLSSRQKGLLTGSTDITSYLKAQSGGSDRTNKEKYQDALDELNDKNNGFSEVEKVKKKKTLKSLKVKSDYAEDITMLHEMAKKDVYAFLSEYKDGKKYAEQLIALDDALTKAGVQEKNKFRDKYGNVTIRPQEKGKGGGGRGGGRSTGLASANSLSKATYKKLGDLLSSASGSVSYKGSVPKVAIRTNLKKAKV